MLQLLPYDQIDLVTPPFPPTRMPTPLDTHGLVLEKRSGSAIGVLSLAFVLGKRWGSASLPGMADLVESSYLTAGGPDAPGSFESEGNFHRPSFPVPIRCRPR